VSPQADDDQTAATPRGPRRSAEGPLASGEAFGSRYHIIRLLGTGGMGAVYQAWDEELGVAIALKVIRPEATADPAAAQDMERRFKRELLLARQVTHPNVVRIHDLGELEGIKYISMPYVEGEDLSTRIKREGKLSVAETLNLSRQVARGLGAAHAAGVVHRDLKPANIMVGKENNALIMDFGIARAATTQAQPDAPTAGARPVTMPTGDEVTVAPIEHTRTGTGPLGAAVSIAQGHIVGTLEYMAPEQARGETVDARADVYALGMMMSEMLLGRRKRAPGVSAMDALLLRIEQPPASLRETNPFIPEALDAIVVKCLQLDPKERFQSTNELLAELSRLDDVGFLIPEPFVKRFMPHLVAAALLLVAALMTGTWWVSRGTAVQEERPPLAILIADFENATNDASFNGTVEPSLGIALEGASFITTYPRANALKLATQLGRSNLNEEAARLLSTRGEDINVILAGRIEANGGGYRIRVRAINPADGNEIRSVTADADSKQDVLQAVSELASTLRDEFGDTTSEAERRADVETFTASSLEAVREYTVGQDLANAGRDEEAITHYQSALAADANFGRAYSGLAVSAYKLGRSAEAEDAYKKAFAVADRMTEREKLRTFGAYYLQFTGNYDKAVENYGELAKRYPADKAGFSNLAMSHFYLLDFAKAMEAGRRAVELYPRIPTFRSNYALFAMYAGDFDTAAAEATKVLETDPKFHKGYLPIALQALQRGDLAGARAAYTKMAATGPAGASLAASGLGDLALYEGAYADAVTTLQSAVETDAQSRRTGAAVAKYAALGEAFVALGNTAEARKSAAAAEARSKSLDARVPAARIFLRAGSENDARRLADELAGQLQPQRRAYARILEAEMAMARRRFPDAVEALLESRKFADLWLARFDLGVAYVEAGAYAEAISELEAAQKRRGEAAAMFLDDWPTAHHLATLEYWLGRAHEGLTGAAGARSHYDAFLKIRSAASKDPLVLDARKRLTESR
jgi:serine/threonine protein kinase/tetratricopeptide (TPR) repeat protein